MADNSFQYTISFKTDADTSGADKEVAALHKVKDAAKQAAAETSRIPNPGSTALGSLPPIPADPALDKLFADTRARADNLAFQSNQFHTAQRAEGMSSAVGSLAEAGGLAVAVGTLKRGLETIAEAAAKASEQMMTLDPVNREFWREKAEGMKWITQTFSKTIDWAMGDLNQHMEAAAESMKNAAEMRKRMLDQLKDRAAQQDKDIAASLHSQDNDAKIAEARRKTQDERNKTQIGSLDPSTKEAQDAKDAGAIALAEGSLAAIDEQAKKAEGTMLRAAQAAAEASKAYEAALNTAPRQDMRDSDPAVIAAKNAKEDADRAKRVAEDDFATAEVLAKEARKQEAEKFQQNIAKDSDAASAGMTRTAQDTIDYLQKTADANDNKLSSSAKAAMDRLAELVKDAIPDSQQTAQFAAAFELLRNSQEARDQQLFQFLTQSIAQTKSTAERVGKLEAMMKSFSERAQGGG